MAISFRAHTLQSTSTTSSLAMVVPAGVVDGDLMLMFFSLEGVGLTTITPSPPAGWTLVNQTNGAGQGFLYSRTANGETAGTTTYTWNFPGCTNIVGSCLVYGGAVVETSATIQNFGSGGGSATWRAPSVTAAAATDWLVCYVYEAGDRIANAMPSGGITPPAGMTLRDNGNSPEQWLGSADKALSSAGATGVQDFTYSANGDDDGISVVLAVASTANKVVMVV